MTRWLDLARTFIGTQEIPGKQTSGKIAAMLRRLGAWWNDDETPWCGVFVGYCLRESGIEIPKYYMRAKEWATWGARLQTDRLSPGAVLVFLREGGGHVGFYVGEDDAAYHVLGGNQSNSVSITRILKHRLLASRWPRDEPVIGGPVRMNVAGRPLSRNEA